MDGETRISRYIERAFGNTLQNAETQEGKEMLFQELRAKYHDYLEQGYESEAAYQAVLGSIGDIFEYVDEIVGAGVSNSKASQSRQDDGCAPPPPPSCSGHPPRPPKDGVCHTHMEATRHDRLSALTPFLVFGLVLLAALFLLGGHFGGHLFHIGPKERSAISTICIIALICVGAIGMFRISRKH